MYLMMPRIAPLLCNFRNPANTSNLAYLQANLLLVGVWRVTCTKRLQNPDASHLSHYVLFDFVVRKFCASEQAPLRCEFATLHIFMGYMQYCFFTYG